MIKHSHSSLPNVKKKKRQRHICLCAKRSYHTGPEWILKLSMHRLGGEVQTAPLGYVLLFKVN